MTRLTRPLVMAALIAVTPSLSVASATPAHAECGTPTSRAEAVVKVDVAGGRSIDELLAAYPVSLASAPLASRGIYVVRSNDPAYCGTYDWAKKLADQVEDHPAVVFAQPDYRADVSDGRFHAWPNGDPTDAGSDPAVWTDQLAAQRLRLADAHARGGGTGVVVAVLDTGVDPGHPALTGRLLPAWDYVDDDNDPRESRNGVDDDADGAIDESFGHGTFVSGLVSLVAPDARILPVRVLDSDGRGNLFVVAEAVSDAADAGADVINLSFGTPYKPESNVLEEAIKEARKRGVVVVAAAGNDASTAEQYPAAQSEVLAVSALAEDATRLAGFANSGGWVDVAAPGERVAGPVPGGGFAWWSGTSVAAPFVSGQLALILAAAPSLDSTQAVDVVTHTTTLLEPSPDAYAIDIVESLSYLD